MNNTNKGLKDHQEAQMSKLEYSETISEVKKIKLDFELDDWQKEILETEGNICICSGRQVGKSQIIAIKVSEYMIKNPKKNILIISVTEDQAEMMIQKILLYLHDNYPKYISRGAKKPTKGRLYVTNGSMVRSKAVGQYGLGILGMTVDVFVPDEAAYLPEGIWASATPMLLTTNGQMWLLSTPNTQEGFFYKAYTDPQMGFKTFHVNSEEVANKRPEPKRSIMLEYLKREKVRMTELQYSQQYLAQFLEELRQLFPDNLIKSSQTLQRISDNDIALSYPLSGEFYLGIDVARMGGDETTFEILERIWDGSNMKYIFRQRDNQMFRYTLTTETIDKILKLDNQYDFIRIYIDDGGLGVAVFDQLLVNEQTRDKVVAINNASRAIDRDIRTRKLLKEDLYLNLKRMMESKEIELLNDSEIASSLKSVVYETTKNTNDVRIYGRYTHIVEGLIRAAWCVRDKKLNLFYEYQ